jgi:hypothetical protein
MWTEDVDEEMFLKQDAFAKFLDGFFRTPS